MTMYAKTLLLLKSHANSILNSKKKEKILSTAVSDTWNFSSVDRRRMSGIYFRVFLPFSKIQSLWNYTGSVIPQRRPSLSLSAPLKIRNLRSRLPRVNIAGVWIINRSTSYLTSEFYFGYGIRIFFSTKYLNDSIDKVWMNF